jgi:hypothetical protein
MAIIADMTSPMGREGVECKFYFCPRGIGGSADPDGEGEVDAPVVPCPSLGGNFAASLTMAAARSLLVLHAGSEIRHCASVYLHPQSQVSALSLCNAAMRCSWVSFDVSIPGSSVDVLIAFKEDWGDSEGDVTAILENNHWVIDDYVAMYENEDLQRLSAGYSECKGGQWVGETPY